MSNEQKLVISLFEDDEFIRMPKIALRAFKGLNALALVILYDLQRLADTQKKERFYCKISYLQDKLGVSKPTAIKCLNFFESKGIINSITHIDSNTKYYKIEKEILANYILNAGVIQSNKNTPKIEKVKEVNIEVPKKQKSENKANECLKVANEIYENAKANNETERGLPRVDKQLWLDFVANKYKLMAKKRKELKSSLIETHFNELRILQEFNIEPNERLQMCIENDYLGLLFDKERERWRKQGKQFQKEVNFAKFSDNSKDDDDIWAGVEVIGVNHT